MKQHVFITKELPESGTKKIEIFTGKGIVVFVQHFQGERMHDSSQVKRKGERGGGGD